MSGVLDRMVKQARGVLPTVQPLAVPRYAPASGARRGILAETEAPAEAGENSRRQNPRPRDPRQFEARENVDQRSQAENEDVLYARESSQPPMRARMEGRRSRSRSQDSDARADKGQSRETDPHSETATLDAVGPRQPDETGRQTQRLAAGEERIEAREHEEDTSTTAESRALKSDEVDAESAARTTPAPLTLMERTELAMEVRNAARIEGNRQGPAEQNRPAQVGPPQPPAEQRTEINISIGSIELRAPRVEARPRQAPFRPQVTLDDFLRRKPEAGA